MFYPCLFVCFSVRYISQNIDKISWRGRAWPKKNPLDFGASDPDQDPDLGVFLKGLFTIAISVDSQELNVKIFVGLNSLGAFYLSGSNRCMTDCW